MEPLTISLFLTPCILRGLITSTISDGSIIRVSKVQTRWMFVVPTILTTLQKRVMHMGYNEAFVLCCRFPYVVLSPLMCAYQIGSTIQARPIA